MRPGKVLPSLMVTSSPRVLPTVKSPGNSPTQGDRPWAKIVEAVKPTRLNPVAKSSHKELRSFKRLKHPIFLDWMLGFSNSRIKEVQFFMILGFRINVIAFC
jgi:hypothetical protein